MSKPEPYCPYCNCRLLMAIEIEHKCCWDCHYAGHDIEEPIIIKTKTETDESKAI
jgi:hypothetical protein